jgi:uncharacterized protein YjbJ (UPF0337 family)
LARARRGVSSTAEAIAIFPENRRHAASAHRRPLAMPLQFQIGNARVSARGRARMNRDEIKGKAEKAKGYVKDKTGEILNNPELEAEGETEQVTGKARETIGKAKRKVQEGVEEITEDTDQ